MANFKNIKNGDIGYILNFADVALLLSIGKSANRYLDQRAVGAALGKSKGSNVISNSSRTNYLTPDQFNYSSHRIHFSKFIKI